MSEEYVFHTSRDYIPSFVVKLGGCPIVVCDDHMCMDADDELAVENAVKTLTGDAEDGEDVRLKFKRPW